jgi:hypothetical protein
MWRPLPFPLSTPGLLKLSMPSGVTIALTAGIGAAAGAVTGAAATTDRVTMDRATDLTAGTGGDVVVAIGGVVTTGETDPVAAHARYHSRLRVVSRSSSSRAAKAARASRPAAHRKHASHLELPDAFAAGYFAVSPRARLRYARRASPFLRGHSPQEPRRSLPNAMAGFFHAYAPRASSRSVQPSSRHGTGAARRWLPLSYCDRSVDMIPASDLRTTAWRTQQPASTSGLPQATVAHPQKFTPDLRAMLRACSTRRRIT